MTEKYYYNNLLPVYIKAIQEARFRENGELKLWILQEDNDSLYSHKPEGKKGLADKLKYSNWIETLVYPGNSPDLNLYKGVWNIIKPRVRTRV
jgi:hypothetical protein